VEVQTPDEAPVRPEWAMARKAVSTDEDCVRRFQAGDKSAFDGIVHRYGAAIYRHIHRLVLNRHDAEDLTQEAFLRAYRYFDRLDSACSLRSWLYTIATRVGLNALRSQRRRGRGKTFSYDAYVDRAGELEEPAARNAHTRTELKDQLHAALAALPPRSALLIQLHHTEGFAIREAAAIVGMSPAAAKVALCRARKELRERLCEEETS
jgi:RNA polymerase sigma-70 factor (ECF subfamily)